MNLKTMKKPTGFSALSFGIAVLAFLFNPTGVFASTESNAQSINTELSALMKEAGVKLGVYAVNTANGDTLAYNAAQRFPVCSTSKVMTVGAILKKSMQAPLLLSEVMHFSKADVAKSGYAPITKQHINTGMTVKALCSAAVSYSDNAAANLLMAQVDGPKGVTEFARSIGDNKFYLVRWEPKLNTAVPGDIRDTSTPKTMSQSLQKLVLGKVLAPKQRKLLKTWLINNTTGGFRIRAGVPKNWMVGDKTGIGSYGTTNDIAVIWPPNCKPIVLSVYYTQKTKDAKPNANVIEKVTQDIIAHFAQGDTCILKGLSEKRKMQKDKGLLMRTNQRGF